VEEPVANSIDHDVWFNQEVNKDPLARPGRAQGKSKRWV